MSANSNVCDVCVEGVGGIVSELANKEYDYISAACSVIYFSKDVPVWAGWSDGCVGGVCAKCRRVLGDAEDGDDPADYCGGASVRVGDEGDVNVCESCVIAALCKCRKSEKTDTHTCSNCHGALVAPYVPQCSCDHPVVVLYKDGEPNLHYCDCGCRESRLQCEACLRLVHDDVCTCVQQIHSRHPVGHRQCSCCNKQLELCPHCLKCMHNAYRDD